MDFQKLNEYLNARILQVLSDIVPGGRLIGSDYVAGSLQGGPGDSFKYNINKHTGADFADDNARFGDIIDLYSKAHNKTPIESARELASQYGYSETPSDMPNFRHFKFGDPVQTWCYRDEHGNPVQYVARYNLPDGSKQFQPFTRGQSGWENRALRAPRPLYNLHKLRQNPDKPVIIVEGERCADRIEEIVANRYICMTWSNGAKAVKSSDFSVLAGRAVLIYPDADAPGVSAAHHIAAILSPIALSISIIDTTGLPEASDVCDNQFDWPTLRAFLIQRKRSYTPQSEIIQPSKPTTPSDPDDAPLVTGSLRDAWQELGIAVNHNGNAICNEDNVLRVFEGCLKFKGHIWLDTFYQRFFHDINGKPQEWRDSDDNAIAIALQRHLGMSQITDSKVYKAMTVYALKNQRNAPRDYLNSLVWDKTPRLSQFFQTICGETDSEYARAISQNFFISMVARIFDPGCKVDTMIILEGPQGIKKSTLLEIIAGTANHSNATESVHSKDFYQCLIGKWIVEFAELHQFSRADIRKVKDILSTKIDHYRASYARTPENHPRMGVFAGTTNESVYLSDDTGGRRFWPIQCQFIDIPAITRDRDQYFAEAVHLYKNGATWYEVPSSADQAQEDRRVPDPWEHTISDFLVDKSTVTTSEIMSNCLKIEVSKQSRFDEIRIGHTLKFLGFSKRRVREKGVLRWLYFRDIQDYDNSLYHKNVDFNE